MKHLDFKTLLEPVQDSYKTFGTIKQQSLCERFFPKQKSKNLEASVIVLEYLIDADQKTRFTFEEIQESVKGDVLDEAKNKKVLLNDALKILRCNKLIIRTDDGYYSLNYTLWYKGVKYKIRDKKVLASLSETILSYIKNDVYLTPDDYFTKMNKLFDFLIKPALTNNSLSKKEIAVYEALQIDEYGIQETIFIMKNGKKIEVIPIGINVGGKSKMLEYQDFDDDSITDFIEIDEIVI